MKPRTRTGFTNCNLAVPAWLAQARTLFAGQLTELNQTNLSISALGATIGETEAQELLLDTLPNALLGLTIHDALLEDNDQMDKLVKRLGELAAALPPALASL